MRLSVLRVTSVAAIAAAMIVIAAAVALANTRSGTSTFVPSLTFYSDQRTVTVNGSDIGWQFRTFPIDNSHKIALVGAEKCDLSGSVSDFDRTFHATDSTRWIALSVLSGTCFVIRAHTGYDNQSGGWTASLDYTKWWNCTGSLPHYPNDC